MTNMKPQNALKRASALAVGKSDPLRLACEINSQVPEAVAHVLHRAMSLNPQERPQTAAEMRALLREASLIAKRDK
jgi:trehalose-6-phosphate synthase